MSLSVFHLDLCGSNGTDAGSKSGSQKRPCVVVGLGLIGSALCQQFRLSGIADYKFQETSFSWGNPDPLIQLLQQVMEDSNYQNMDLVWSAGKGRFAATDEEMEKETEYFKTVMGFLDSSRCKSICVNFLSSAGGIYENSGRITNRDEISPSRPYALAKVYQEKLLQESGLRSRIYRVSSVYGPCYRYRSAGLVNTLVSNTAMGLNTTIYAGLNTMRDYIFSDDVARTIVDDIRQNRSSEMRILATGRAISVNMLVNLVGKVAGKRAKATYVPDRQNHRDIIFSPAIIDSSKVNTSLEEGIRIVSGLLHFQKQDGWLNQTAN